MIGKTNAQVKIDTSDATATSNDILLGKTAYANDEKIVGTIPTYNNEHENGYIPTRSIKLLLDATKSCYFMFYNYTGTTIPDGALEYNDTSNVTTASRMFASCTNLKTIPQLDTSKVTDMEFMFSSCSSLETIPQLDTSKVTIMNNMFQNCNVLKTIPQLDTSNVTSMYNIFYNCKSLTTIPQLDTSKSTNLSSMFYGCTNLTTIPQLDTSKSTNLSSMFYGCINLTTIPQLDTSNSTSLSDMFSGCTNLKTIPQLDMIKAKYVSYMFSNCSNLTNLTLLNIQVDLQIGSGTSWGHLLTIDSLVNTCKECIKQSESRTLTVGSANLEKLASVYVKFVDPTQTEIAVGSKGDIVVCESTDEGAMLIANYMQLKSWALA